MGDVPEWYVLLREADRLHCAPWELLERPDRDIWRSMARGALDAEKHAADMRSRRRQT